jgi:TRAP-type C4-dicarboxylate transport system substrate-binding protein
VTKEPRGIVVGATVIKKESFNALPDDLKKALIETSRTAEKALATAIRRDDQRAFDAIVKKGVKPVSVAANRRVWDEVLEKARHSLVGKLYPADLLKRVESIAQAVG